MLASLTNSSKRRLAIGSRLPSITLAASTKLAADIYLKGYADGCEAKAGIAGWIAFYNEQRLHQALGYRTPMAVWRAAATTSAVDMMDNAAVLPTCPQQQTTADNMRLPVLGIV
jgi:Integrase core domain